MSITAIMLYSTDDFGHPSGWDEGSEDFQQRHVWRTGRLGNLYGLGVLSGLPPDSLVGPPINAPDFSVTIPLIEGENDFTIVAEPGGGTPGDQFDRFALNLYFDGVFDRPGISVLFQRTAPPEGEVPTPNRSGEVFPFSLEAPLRETAPTAYDDGLEQTTVSAASFLPPELFVSVDKVSAYAVAPSGSPNWIGVMKVFVEASPDAGGAAAPGGFQGFTGPANVGASVRVGPDLSGGPRGGGSGLVAPGTRGADASHQPRAEWQAVRSESPSPAAEPTAFPTAPSTAEGSPTAAATASTPRSQATVSRTEGVQGTPTPKRTPDDSTPTAKVSPAGDAGGSGGATPAASPAVPAAPMPTPGSKAKEKEAQ